LHQYAKQNAFDNYKAFFSVFLQSLNINTRQNNSRLCV